MALHSFTKTEVINRIETLVRRLTKQESLSYMEHKLVEDAFNSAIVDMCVDTAIPHWRFLLEDVTADTTSGTAYVDIDANVFNVISGTVRIEAENATLDAKSLEALYSSDPGIEATGPPLYYAFDSSASVDQIRLRLWPVPDATYTIAFVAESIPDEDSIASFPSWMHSCLKDKAFELALRDLGLFIESAIYAASYEKRKHAHKQSQGYDGPRHIRRRGGGPTTIDIQSRIPT